VASDQPNGSALEALARRRDAKRNGAAQIPGRLANE